jgi:hypothetical protein
MRARTFAPHDEGRLLQRRGWWGQVQAGEFVPLPLPMGGGTFGTLSTLDTLAATQQSIAQYGEDRAWSEVNAAMMAHNRQMLEILGVLVERTPDRQRRYGSAASKNMQVADQFGRPQAQKVTAGVTLGFPLRLYEDALQWTRKFVQAPGSAQQLAAEFDAILDADRRQVMYEIKSALFGPTNYTFTDVLIDNVALAVKRLANADSAAIPLGPNGESFNAATHTHYLFTASTALAAADLSALISTVLEHTNRGTVQVWINSAQETAVRGLTGFVADIAAYIVRGGAATTDVTDQTLDLMNPQNRRIGMFGAAEIWVKPYIPSGYLAAISVGNPEAPIVFRFREGGGDLQLVFEDDNHPLRARGYEREFGCAVYNRVGAAVLFVDAGSAGAYTAPSLVA